MTQRQIDIWTDTDYAQKLREAEVCARTSVLYGGGDGGAGTEVQAGRKVDTGEP